MTRRPATSGLEDHVFVDVQRDGASERARVGRRRLVGVDLGARVHGQVTVHVDGDAVAARDDLAAVDKVQGGGRFEIEGSTHVPRRADDRWRRRSGAAPARARQPCAYAPPGVLKRSNISPRLGSPQPSSVSWRLLTFHFLVIFNSAAWLSTWSHGRSVGLGREYVSAADVFGQLDQSLMPVSLMPLTRELAPGWKLQTIQGRRGVTASSVGLGRRGLCPFRRHGGESQPRPAPAGACASLRRRPERTRTGPAVERAASRGAGGLSDARLLPSRELYAASRPRPSTRARSCSPSRACRGVVARSTSTPAAAGSPSPLRHRRLLRTSSEGGPAPPSRARFAV